MSCFLNGDGEANVIRADGLGHFHLSPEYRECGGKLSKPQISADRDNGNFDVLVANPPFSVRQCKLTVEHGSESFELIHKMTNDSSEIEILFLERAKQLLAPGGVAGIIFPVSILSNGGIGTEGRLFLLKHFHIIGIVGLGNSTFMKTGTNTVVLFLERRPHADERIASAIVEAFLENGNEIAVFGQTDVFGRYADYVLGTDLASYNSLLRDPTQETEVELFQDYHRSFLKSSSCKKLQKSRAFEGMDTAGKAESLRRAMRVELLKVEALRLRSFILTLGRNVVAVNAPTSKKSEEKFLGYKFSDRMGYEGMQVLSSSGDIETPLYDPFDRDSPLKIAPIIRAAYEGNYVEIPEDLSNFCKVVPLHAMIDFSQADFGAVLSTVVATPRRRLICGSEKLGSVCKIMLGATPLRARRDFYNGGTEPWVSISDMTGHDVITETAEKITAAGVASSSVKLIPAGTTLMSFKLTIGRVSRAGMPLYTNEAIAGLVRRDDWLDRISDDYIFCLFNCFADDLLRHGSMSGKMFGKSLNKGLLENVGLPILDVAQQVEFVRIWTHHSNDPKARRAALEPFLWLPLEDDGGHA